MGHYNKITKIDNHSQMNDYLNLVILWFLTASLPANKQNSLFSSMVRNHKNGFRPLTPTVPCRDPSGGERLEGVSVAQQLLLLHLIQDVLAEHTGEAELAVAHQREHQVHQLFQDVLR